LSTEWTQLGFLAYTKNVFPRKWHHHNVTGGCDLSQNVQACLTDPMIPSVTF